MKKVITLLTILLAFIGLHSQNERDNYNLKIREDVGDLNNDGLADEVVALMDTIHKTRPLKLMVFFKQPNGKMKLVVSSTKIIAPQFPEKNNYEYSGHQIPSFFIKDGILNMECYENGMSIHKFKYRNGNFELIHFSKTLRDGYKFTDIEFDLISGKYSKQSQNLGEDEFFDKVEKKITIKPLPKIKDIVPFKSEYF